MAISNYTKKINGVTKSSAFLLYPTAPPILKSSHTWRTEPNHLSWNPSYSFTSLSLFFLRVFSAFFFRGRHDYPTIRRYRRLRGDDYNNTGLIYRKRDFVKCNLEVRRLFPNNELKPNFFQNVQNIQHWKTPQSKNPVSKRSLRMKYSPLLSTTSSVLWRDLPPGERPWSYPS